MHEKIKGKTWSYFYLKVIMSWLYWHLIRMYMNQNEFDTRRLESVLYHYSTNLLCLHRKSLSLLPFFFLAKPATTPSYPHPWCIKKNTTFHALNIFFLLPFFLHLAEFLTAKSLRAFAEKKKITTCDQCQLPDCFFSMCQHYHLLL